ncbi:twin-arginine translocase subunit TatC [Pseudolysinimonas yzui]|uniref:Sec-independent protein translocase protein TatC n=1 Tax=Pseudolysinimonas yzui TaxID=2708254 RepID=A0A8J3GMP4_9MICO|nr:twin-arginine translocase subunit TatC [Pseudolysinimonas yzui]GHF05319.1 Sec-independent protein translocase protein TatC [Pseudolysinimonas yzui]
MSAPTAREPRTRDRRTTLAGHLRELRKRLLISAAALLVAAVTGFFVAPLVVGALRTPIQEIAAHRDAEIVYTTVSGAFDLRMVIAITIGIVASSPVWLYQLFAFLVPGLTSRERGYTFGFFFSAVPLFLLGCLAGWFVFPHMVELMTSFSSDEEATYLDARVYYDFVVKLVLAVGIGFVFPVFLVLLNFVGVLSARAIAKGWRIAILAICIFTALATPAADVASMFVLAIPMILLYLVALAVAGIHDRRLARRLGPA